MSIEEFEGDGWEISGVAFGEPTATFRFGEQCEHGPPEAILVAEAPTDPEALAALRGKIQTLQDATAAAIAWIDQELAQ